MNKALVIAVVALVFSAGALFFPRTVERVVETVNLGSGSGQNVGSTQFFEASLVDGGGCYATTSSGVLLPRLLENKCITITPTSPQAVLSLTLPASTTMNALIGKTPGACRSWWIDASGVVAATTTTIVKGTGWDLVGQDATGAGTGADVIDGLEHAVLTGCRQADGDITGFVEEWIHAD